MKKKSLNKKLQLTKKTIAELNDNMLQDIQGGATMPPYCINIQTSPIICRPIPVTTTRTTVINSLACPSLACPSLACTSGFPENPGNQF